MFRCGVDYTRCRWIMPLLLIFAIIFDLIAIAAQSGWVVNDDETHYTSMWKECRGRDDNWDCNSLMENNWAKAVAALMIIGFIILVFAFIICIVAMCDPNNGSFIAVGVLLFVVVILQFIALIVYPVHFNNKIFEGQYDYTWAYGFGWGATIICLGCSFIFCCLTRCLDEITGDEKIKYIYTSQ
ncbi:p53 apoptosis effector related to PMP-22 [Anableps anableps]